MASETAPLRAREETSVGLAAVHRYEAGDDLLLRERACPEPDAPAGESERGDVRTRIRRGLRLTMAAAGMAATAAALILTVWTERSRTLQGAWRPVPGLDLHATYSGEGSWAGKGGAQALGEDAALPALPSPTLPALGAPKVSSTWARRAGMERLIGLELHGTPGALPLVRRVAKPPSAARQPPPVHKPSQRAAGHTAGRALSRLGQTSDGGVGPGADVDTRPHAEVDRDAGVNPGEGGRAGAGGGVNDDAEEVDASDVDSETDAFLKRLYMDSNMDSESSRKLTLPGTPESNDPEELSRGKGIEANAAPDNTGISGVRQEDDGGGVGDVEIAGSIKPPVAEDVFANFVAKSHEEVLEAAPLASDLKSEREFLAPSHVSGVMGAGDFMVPGGAEGPEGGGEDAGEGGARETPGGASDSSDSRGVDAAPASLAPDSQFSSFSLPSELFEHEEGGGSGGGKAGSGVSGGGGASTGGGGGSGRWREKGGGEPVSTGARYGADADGRDYDADGAGDSNGDNADGRGSRDSGESRRGSGAFDTAAADADFAHKIANILKADRDEDRKWDLASEVLHSHLSGGGGGINSHAIARSVSKHLKRSLSRLNTNTNTNTNNNDNNNNNNNNNWEGGSGGGGGGASDEDLALRVAEILRPVLAARNDGGDLGYLRRDAGNSRNSAVGSSPDHSGQGLIKININTNDNGIGASAPAAAADVVKAQLYNRVVYKMVTAAGEGGAPLDPSLEKAAQLFVDELANSGSLEHPGSGGGEAGTSKAGTSGSAPGVPGASGASASTLEREKRVDSTLDGNFGGNTRVPDNDEGFGAAGLEDESAGAAESPESAGAAESPESAGAAESLIEGESGNHTAAGAARSYFSLSASTAPTAEEVEATLLESLARLAEAGKRQRNELMSEVLEESENGSLPDPNLTPLQFPQYPDPTGGVGMREADPMMPSDQVGATASTFDAFGLQGQAGQMSRGGQMPQGGPMPQGGQMAQGGQVPWAMQQQQVQQMQQLQQGAGGSDAGDSFGVGAHGGGSNPGLENPGNSGWQTKTPQQQRRQDAPRQPAWAAAAAQQQLQLQHETLSQLRPQQDGMARSNGEDTRGGEAATETGHGEEMEEEVREGFTAVAATDATLAASVDGGHPATLMSRKVETAHHKAPKKQTKDAEEAEPDAGADADADDDDFRAVPLMPGERDGAPGAEGAELEEALKEEMDGEEPAGPEVAGIDGVLNTAEAIDKVWGVQPKVARFMLPGDLAAGTAVRSSYHTLKRNDIRPGAVAAEEGSKGKRNLNTRKNPKDKASLKTEESPKDTASPHDKEGLRNTGRAKDTGGAKEGNTASKHTSKTASKTASKKSSRRVPTKTSASTRSQLGSDASGEAAWENSLAEQAQDTLWALLQAGGAGSGGGGSHGDMVEPSVPV